jgi:hypothetical protein
LCERRYPRFRFKGNAAKAAYHQGRDRVGWLSVSMDGRFAYSSTGEIIDAAKKGSVAALQDETGRQVQSEKVLDLIIAK